MLIYELNLLEYAANHESLSLHTCPLRQSGTEQLSAIMIDLPALMRDGSQYR
jgi:hypothetical protein